MSADETPTLSDRFGGVAERHIAAKAQADLAPLEKAIALMEELRAWSEDEATKDSFDVETFYDPKTQKTLLVGSYGELANETSDVPTIILGVPSAATPGTFKVVMGLTDYYDDEHQERFSDLIKQNRHSAEYTAETADQPVLAFMYAYMSAHPSFREFLSRGADAVCEEVRAKNAPQPKT